MSANRSEHVETIDVQGTAIAVITKGDRDDYLSLTDLASYVSDAPQDVVKNWMRSRATIEYLGVWEQLHNPAFKLVEFDQSKTAAGSHSFVISPTKCVQETGAIGIRVKRGRGGGTFAHVDIAFEFVSWLSPEFKLCVIQDYQRLKQDENNRLSQSWNEKRLFSKLNYQLHTDAIRDNLVTEAIPKESARFVNADETDVLNVALFGMTAKQWRDANPSLDGNMRDYASIAQLLVLANLESMNAELLKQWLPRDDRARRLNLMALQQLASLEGNRTYRGLQP